MSDFVRFSAFIILISLTIFTIHKITQGNYKPLDWKNHIIKNEKSQGYIMEVYQGGKVVFKKCVKKYNRLGYAVGGREFTSGFFSSSAKDSGIIYNVTKEICTL